MEPFPGAASINLRLGFNQYEHTEIEPTGEPGTTFDNEALHEPVASSSSARTACAWRSD